MVRFNPIFNSSSSFVLSRLDKVTTGTWTPTPVESVIIKVTD